MGTVTLEQGPNGVLISADVSGLTPGPHGFHIHDVGACTPDFSAAGSHFAPSGHGHGFMYGDDQHAGDLPNLYAAGDGTARADVFTSKITLAADAGNSQYVAGARKPGSRREFRRDVCTLAFGRTEGGHMPESGDPQSLYGPNATTRRLLDAAAAEFLERGYDGSVISNIARRAGLSTGAIFSRWPTKDDIMVAAVDHILDKIGPRQRLADLGTSVDAPPVEILVTWGTDLLTADFAQSAFKHLFGSAHAYPSIQQRLQEFLEKQADQLSALVEQGKDEGLCDPELSTTALALMIQAIGVGTDLLISVGRSEHLIPSQQEWADVIVRMLAAAAADSARSSDA